MKEFETRTLYVYTCYHSNVVYRGEYKVRTYRGLYQIMQENEGEDKTFPSSKKFAALKSDGRVFKTPCMDEWMYLFDRDDNKAVTVFKDHALKKAAEHAAWAQTFQNDAVEMHCVQRIAS